MFSDSVIFFINLVCGKIIIKLYNMSFYCQYKIAVLPTIFTRLYNNKKADLFFFLKHDLFTTVVQVCDLFLKILIFEYYI